MHKILDTIGKVCPFPLVEAKKEMKALSSGDTLTIYFDCIQGTESLPLWIAEEGHTATNFEQVEDGIWHLTIQKK